MVSRYSNLKQLSPKEFDASLLQKLTEEGRVYIEFPRSLERNAYMREVLDYVQSINDYATDLWKGKVDDLWQRILNNECMSEFLTVKKGIHTGHMNRYAVTTLVCMMQSNSVYRRDVPMITLHLRLEGITKKNKYYTSCGKYVLTREERAVFRRLLEK